MDTSKVFTAFDNEDNEILIYRENSDSFFDLNSEQALTREDFDLQTLRYLRETLWVMRYMPENFIKKLYEIDRKKLVKSTNFLLGLKGQISRLEETKKVLDFYYNGIPFYNRRYEWSLTNPEWGIYTFLKTIKLKDVYCNLYKNMYNGKIYMGFASDINKLSELSQFGNGMEYVKFNNATLESLIKEPIIEKKKVYEYANSARKCEVGEV